ncbi:L,D-transpeptidase family protein [Acinetobacter beijerinckii]|uniref:L,D-transpeptidase family protein n=1 Tax=Acinetobacter beijerinckii TaxID=262668 RepID=UPI0023DDB8F4|nr:L,D-transpeptidase [Acinetobacter beijerinckii]MDF2418549.1 L,D-transpeptidase family protein [Acinetobacter beijerinckii]
MFVRSLLAMSLSCIIANVAFAAPTTEQPLNPKKISASVQDPIDPLEVERSAASSVVAQPASSVADNAVSDPQVNTGVASAVSSKLETTPESSTANNVTPAVKVSWTLDSMNNAEWPESLPKGQLPAYARAHVMLNNAHASPGAIDGANGKNTLKAIASFQQMNGLTPTGQLTQETWDALVAKQTKPAYVEYTITDADLKGPYADSIPSDYALQAKMKGLYYTRVTEMLGEKFHMDENFLKKLNPTATFKKAGEKIIVANVRNDLPEDIHLIVAHKGARQLYLFNSRNQMIASFPATIGSTDTPSPTGTYKVVGVAKNPWYSYSPSNFIQGKNLKPLSLPPGPNAPVGNIWIGLSKKSFGIHGTPNPSLISKTASHGCIRLTNWDANDLGAKVRSGVTVKFLE